MIPTEDYSSFEQLKKLEEERTGYKISKIELTKKLINEKLAQLSKGLISSVTMCSGLHTDSFRAIGVVS